MNFLICSERSGSNFITSLMNGHSQISAPPPTHLIRLFAVNGHRYAPLSERLNWEAFKSDVRLAFEAMPGRWMSMFPETSTDLLEPDRSIPCVLNRIYEAERILDRAQVSFVKENLTYSFIDYLMIHWPKAKYVYQVRDPRDMALSLFNTENMPGGIVEGVDQWISDQIGSINAIWKLPPESVLRIRYEDLLTEPVKSCEKLCSHMGLAYESTMLDFHKAARTIENASMMRAWSNLDKGVLGDNYGKFMTGLSDCEIEYVEMRCSELMDYFGYDRVTTVKHMNSEEKEIRVRQLENLLRAPKKAKPESSEDDQMRRRRRHLISVVKSRESAVQSGYR